ncbi:MAG: hypothetical protein ACXWV4_02655 [Flavitalea sp.]
MNQLKAYEITVKGKLEAIPLPDLQDAIWARIEAQLDTDMPTDDGNNGPLDSPTGPLILGSSILAFLITLLTLYFTQKNSDNASEGIENQNKTFQNSVPGADSGPPGNNSGIQPVTPANSTGDLRTNEGSTLNESVVNQNGGSDITSSDLQNGQQGRGQENLQPGTNEQQNPAPGSNLLQENLLSNQPGGTLPQTVEVPKNQTQNTVVIKPPPKDSVVTGKKSRGVKGVTDNDYRIVPKKDN